MCPNHTEHPIHILAIRTVQWFSDNKSIVYVIGLPTEGDIYFKFSLQEEMDEF